MNKKDGGKKYTKRAKKTDSSNSRRLINGS